jgi:hypothetical protein
MHGTRTPNPLALSSNNPHPKGSIAARVWERQMKRQMGLDVDDFDDVPFDDEDDDEIPVASNGHRTPKEKDEDEGEQYARVPRSVLRSGIGVGPIAVYASLVDHANREHACWPSHALMAKELGVARSTVQRYLTVLEAAGFIHVERRENTSHKYFVVGLDNLRKRKPKW